MSERNLPFRNYSINNLMTKFIGQEPECSLKLSAAKYFYILSISSKAELKNKIKNSNSKPDLNSMRHKNIMDNLANQDNHQNRNNSPSQDINNSLPDQVIQKIQSSNPLLLNQLQQDNNVNQDGNVNNVSHESLGQFTVKICNVEEPFETLGLVNVWIKGVHIDTFSDAINKVTEFIGLQPQRFKLAEPHIFTQELSFRHILRDSTGQQSFKPNLIYRINVEKETIPPNDEILIMDISRSSIQQSNSKIESENLNKENSSSSSAIDNFQQSLEKNNINNQKAQPQIKEESKKNESFSSSSSSSSDNSSNNRLTNFLANRGNIDENTFGDFH